MADKERWQQLCEQAAVEQDPEKLMALVHEINHLLAERDARLKANRERNDVRAPGTKTGTQDQ
jgi:hypothetical protein